MGYNLKESRFLRFSLCWDNIGTAYLLTPFKMTAVIMAVFGLRIAGCAGSMKFVTITPGIIVTLSGVEG